MNYKEQTKRYILFIISLFFSALGVAFTKHGELGVSPISSVANVVNCKFPAFSLGTLLIVWNCVLILGQILLLQKSFQLIQLLQIPLSFLFGWFTDLGMYLVASFPVTNYFLRLIMVLLGIIILGFGISLSVIANVIMNSGEAFVKAVSDTTKKNFGNIKIGFDILCVILSILLSLFFFDLKIVGTREGTVLSALLTGMIVKVFTKYLKTPLDSILQTKETMTPVGQTADSLVQDLTSAPQNTSKQHLVVTIAREYGSGGREIGKQLAERLHIPYYDLDMIHKAAQESGLSEKVISENEQKVKNTAAHSLYFWYIQPMPQEELPLVEQVFEVQSKIIRDIASKESCVIVGRLANFILQKDYSVFRIFVGATKEAKIERVMKRDRLNAKEAKEKIKKVEHERSNHCYYFTHKHWKDLDNYDFYLKSDFLGIDASINLLSDMIERREIK